tara:strand:- start:322 stop:504 length:183 start_codon:yes stop_codon:yes gene_type:complete
LPYRADVRVVADDDEVWINIGGAFEVEIQNSAAKPGTYERTRFLCRSEILEQVHAKRMRI